MTDDTAVQKPGDWLENAIQLHEDRRFDEAKSLYLKVLEVHPHHAGTRHMLGLAEYQSGQYDAAIAHLKKAAAAEPRNAVYAGNLGMAYRAKGDLERAVTTYKKALGLDPSIASLHHNLGLALQQNGDHRAASDSFRKALGLNARYAEAEAGIGLSQMKLGEFEQAISHFRKAIDLDPELAAAHTNMGLTYLETGRISAAVESLNRSLALVPDPAIFTRLGETLYDANRLPEAFAAFSEALALKPNDRDLLCHLARTEAKRGQLDQAEQLYHAAIGSGDKRASTHFALANVLVDLGRPHEAVQNYRWAIKADPDLAIAHRMIAFATKHGPESADIAAIHDAHARTAPGSNARKHLGFALGKVEEDVGHYNRAFTHFIEANRLHRQTISYDAYQTRHWAESIMPLFNSDLFARNQAAGLTDDGPLFIVGMPQSGIERVAGILAAHPQIYVAGDLKMMAPLFEEAGVSDPDTLFTDRIAEFGGDRFADLGRTYLSRTKHLAPDARYLANANGANFWRVGMIKLILPHARILHCTRTPVDNCLSIFRHFSASEDDNFAYDLGELGTYYLTYQRLMAHWHSVLPRQIYDLHYEDLIADPEAESRKLLNALGLEWNDALFKPHAENWSDSAGASAENYGEALTPLIEALADAG